MFRQDAYDFEDLVCRVAPGGIIQFVLGIYQRGRGPRGESKTALCNAESRVRGVNEHQNSLIEWQLKRSSTFDRVESL